MTTVLDTTIRYDGLNGRGAVSNAVGRYEKHSRVLLDDGWDDGWRTEDGAPPPLRTEVIHDATRTIIARNQSPDISFDQSINPYRGCEHGCIYCFARPSHAYLGLSPGVDFESRLFAKPNAAELFSSDRFDRLIQSQLQQFDHVIIDAPPVLGLADAPLLARKVEGVIFTVQANGTTIRAIRIALTRMRMSGARLFGAIVTKIGRKNELYGYGYGDGYGYGYGASSDKEA